MKSLVPLILLFLLSFTLKAQTITGDCHDIAISNLPAYQPNLIESAYVTANSGCLKHIAGVYLPAKPHVWLEEKDWAAGGTWIDLTGPTGHTTHNMPFNPFFTGVAHGTYRIRTRVPVVYTTPTCPNGITYVNAGDQVVGKQAVLDPHDYYSNETIVGATDATDIQAAFFSGGSSPNSYDNGDDPVLDCSGSKNYDEFWIAIFENGPPNRYASFWNSWQQGPMVNPQLSMTYIFSGTNNWQWNFVDFTSYTAQFAIRNSSCPSQPVWTHLDRDFFICPVGSGCKLSRKAEDLREIKVGNTQSLLRIMNVRAVDAESYSLIITGADGRMYKKLNQLDASLEVDIQDLPSGMYVVHLYQANEQRFVGKIVK